LWDRQGRTECFNRRASVVEARALKPDDDDRTRARDSLPY